MVHERQPLDLDGDEDARRLIDNVLRLDASVCAQERVRRASEERDGQCGLSNCSAADTVAADAGVHRHHPREGGAPPA